MAAKIEKRWYWMIPTEAFTDTPAGLVIDILRYDGARVESNSPPGLYLFSSDRAPNLDRLKSYHVQPIWGPVGPAGRDYAAGQAWFWYHEQAKVAEGGR
jgi:hypothetical protein